MNHVPGQGPSSPGSGPGLLNAGEGVWLLRGSALRDALEGHRGLEVEPRAAGPQWASLREPGLAPPRPALDPSGPPCRSLAFPHQALPQVGQARAGGLQ